MKILVYRSKLLSSFNALSESHRKRGKRRALSAECEICQIARVTPFHDLLSRFSHFGAHLSTFSFEEHLHSEVAWRKKQRGRSGGDEGEARQSKELGREGKQASSRM